MKISIIGASGDMGKFLVSFLSPLGEIQSISRKNSQSEWDEAWKADVVWLSIPRDAIDLLLKNKKFRKDQVIVDICSIKRNLSEVIQKTGATHLSLHPLHGPNIPWSGQRWAVIPASKNILDNSRAKVVLSFLKKQGIHFVEAESEDYHDFMIALTLSMPELLTIVIESIIEKYIKENNYKMPSRSELNKWSVPASNALFGAYYHIINSTPCWLRKDILCKAHGDLIKNASEAFKDLSELTEKDVEKKFEKQAKDIKTLSPEERVKIRLWVENWFVDSTKTIFIEKDYSKTKPEIIIQCSKEIDKIFPNLGRKIKIGIHGIEGCFTHESILRFCEENKINKDKLDLRFLVTAENVLRALAKGEIDRGVFAMANSGSGAYVSSMDPMGKYNYDVLAVYGMKIMQCLLAHPDSAIESITEVFGHPQAVSQCKRTLAEKYPKLKLVYGNDEDDTALCAKKIADRKLPKTTATLASQIAAKLYNLHILSYNMHHDPFNTTTFLVVKKRV